MTDLSTSDQIPVWQRVYCEPTKAMALPRLFIASANLMIRAITVWCWSIIATWIAGEHNLIARGDWGHYCVALVYNCDVDC